MVKERASFGFVVVAGNDLGGFLGELGDALEDILWGVRSEVGDQLVVDRQVGGEDEEDGSEEAEVESEKEMDEQQAKGTNQKKKKLSPKEAKEARLAAEANREKRAREKFARDSLRLKDLQERAKTPGRALGLNELIGEIETLRAKTPQWRLKPIDDTMLTKPLTR